MAAQELIKSAGTRLALLLKSGTGVSLGTAKDIGAGAFQSTPSKTLYTTETTHSANSDYKFNNQPRAFQPSTSPSVNYGTGKTSPSPAKFDAAEYARKKKAELDKYREEKDKPAVAEDADVLRMLQQSKIDESKPAGPKAAFVPPSEN
jgi:hypothetical protein